MLWYVHACVVCSTYNKRFQVLFLSSADWVKRALIIWTRRGSGWLQYRRCTFYDDCAITSVFLFWKSENLEEQICNKVYIFLLHFVQVSALCTSTEWFGFGSYHYLLERVNFMHLSHNLSLLYKLPFKSRPIEKALGIHPWSSGSETWFHRRAQRCPASV